VREREGEEEGREQGRKGRISFPSPRYFRVFRARCLDRALFAGAFFARAGRESQAAFRVPEETRGETRERRRALRKLRELPK